MPEELPYTSGAIDLINCAIVNYRGTAIIIDSMLTEFNIYFDIYKNHARCDITINDSQGLSELFPIVGDESLVIRFKTPEAYDKFEDAFEVVFQVFSVENKQHTKTQEDVYVIHGISSNWLENKLISVHRTFNDVKLVPILENLFNSTKKSKTPIPNNKPLEIDPRILAIVGQKKYTYSFPNQQPFECIEFITNETKLLENKPANIIFYESEKTFRWWWFDKLFDPNDNPPVDTFYFAEAANEIPEDADKPIYEYQKIMDMSVERHVDVIDNIEKGLYHNSVSGLDLVCKRYLTKDFIYDNSKQGSSKLTHIDGGIYNIYTSGTNYKEKEDSVNSFSLFTHVRFDEQIPYYLQSEYLIHAESERSLLNKDTDIKNFRTKQEFFHFNVASKAQSRFLQINITIPGNSDIRVGNMINVIIPQSNPYEDKSEEMDKNFLYNQRFLITKVRHTYNKVQRNYFTTLECVKDSYYNKPREFGDDWNLQTETTRELLKELAGTR